MRFFNAIHSSPKGSASAFPASAALEGGDGHFVSPIRYWRTAYPVGVKIKA